MQDLNKPINISVSSNVQVDFCISFSKVVLSLEPQKKLELYISQQKSLLPIGSEESTMTAS